MIKELGLILGTVFSMSAVPLRAPGENTLSFNITTSTVAEDLSVFYHNQYPKNTLSYLVPNTKNGDQYDDFKLLTMYAYQGDLYLYFFASSPFTFDDVRMEYSISTTLSEDSTTIIEDWHERGEAFQCSVHDYNGSDKKFYKVVAEDFYDHDVGDVHRVKVKKLNMYQGDEYHYMCRDCDNAEYSWKDAAQNEDQVYTYYKDNYLIVNDAKYIQQLVNTKYSTVTQTQAVEAREINWLFFTYDYSSLGPNYQLGKLKEIDIAYEYLSYTATYRVDGAPHATLYAGGYKNPDSFFDRNGHGSREAEFTLNKSNRLETTVTPSTRTIDTVTDQATIFFFWNITHKINYSYNTIQALDDNSLSSIGDADFKKFCESQRDHYKWAIDFREDNRVLQKTENDVHGFVEWWKSTQKATTTCHQASSVTATRFVFENQDGTAELNAIMNPVEISETLATSPTVYTTVSFTLGSEEATRKFWIIVGIIGGILGLAGIIYLIIKLKRKGVFKKKPKENGGNKDMAYRSKSYKPYKAKKAKKGYKRRKRY